MSDVVRARLAALTAELSAGPPAPAAASPDAAPDDARASGGDRCAGPAPRRAVAVREALLRFGREHVAVLGVVGLIGVIWAAWTVFAARTVPVAQAEPTPTLVASATPSPAPTIRVHVLGAVASPGVVSLPVGARVEDALAAAGGLTDAARPGELNLAAVVADGVQLVVGDASAPGGEMRRDGGAASGGGVAGGAASGLLDLNTATAAQLEDLPGVGPVTAAAILAWRQEHRRFSRVEELNEVDGIGPKTYARIAPHVRV